MKIVLRYKQIVSHCVFLLKASKGVAACNCKHIKKSSFHSSKSCHDVEIFVIPCLLILSLWAVSRIADKLVLVQLWNPVIHQIWNVPTQEVISQSVPLQRKKKRPPVPGSDISPWRHGVSIAFAHTNTVRKKFDCFLTSAGIDVCQTGFAVIGGWRQWRIGELWPRWVCMCQGGRNRCRTLMQLLIFQASATDTCASLYIIPSGKIQSLRCVCVCVWVWESQYCNSLVWLLMFHSSEWFQCVHLESGISFHSPFLCAVPSQTPIRLPYVYAISGPLTLRLLYLSSFSLSFQIPPALHSHRSLTPPPDGCV